jgi:Fe2+ transport system protein FeoA
MASSTENRYLQGRLDKSAATTLRDIAPGRGARVAGFAADIRPEVGRRLQELGFGRGDLVHCLRAAPLGGPRVYAVSGCAFALDSALAGQVLIDAEESHGDS